MITLSIDTAYNEQAMSHGDVCNKKLKLYSQEELLELALLARKANNPALIRCFKNLPSLADLTDEKLENEQAAVIAPEEHEDESTDEHEEHN